MGNVHLLETRRVRIYSDSIRKQLAALRRVKALRGSSAPPPDRNPALDAFLANLLDVQEQLMFETAQFRNGADTRVDEHAILAMAQAVLADTAEMIELLQWLGARAEIAPCDDAGQTAQPVA